ncbi:cellulase family glycosylhydrolase [Paenibacillus hodogayensis]|uniref:Cellulase family glycosylhydrolase n=1 Tax=Paenibacillus hodogayensis TaxID=279208 RepID=A0ABV5W3K0_9BACL
MKKQAILVFLSILLLCPALSVKPALAEDSDFYGVVEHLQRYSDYADMIDRIAASGTRWVRISPEWGSIETAKGVHNATFLLRLDDIVDRLRAKGIHVLFILSFTAPWASSNPADTAGRTRYKPADWADWENYVQFIASRYDSKVNYWEVWNEPDHPTFWKSSVADYQTLLAKAYAKLKAVNPDNRVLMGGLALNNGTVDVYGPGTFLDQLLAGGGGAYFDIVNYHAYGSATSMLAKYNGVMSILNNYGLGGRDIWITETGYENTGGMENRKADFADETYLLHKSLPTIKKLFWYNFRRVSGTNPNEHNFGLTDTALQPLKAFYHFQAANGANAFFGEQTEGLLTLELNPLPVDSGYSFTGNVMQVAAGQYAYFKINDNWLYGTNDGLDPVVYVDVTYQDTGTGMWRLQYDAPGNAYAEAGQVHNTGSDGWNSVTFAVYNGRLANSQSGGSDFRLWAESGPLTVQKVSVRKEAGAARSILRESNREKLMEQVKTLDSTKDNFTTTETVGGLVAGKIGGDNKFAYFRVSDALVRAGDSSLTIGVQYFDAGTDSIRIQYNSASSAYQNLYIAKTNTHTWKTARFTVSNAHFTNQQSFYADLRIGNNYDGSAEYIRMVEIIR